MPPPLRLLMLGTGDFALPTFEHLCETGHRVIGLITQPDRPQGRKQEIIPSPIKRAAQARGIPVDQPENVNAPEEVGRIRELGADLLITAAYGQILSAELLSVPPLGGINLHGSILPAYRGAAPVARAIQNGEAEAGVTVIRMSPQIDAGGMLLIGRTPVDPDETAGELEARLARLGAPMVAEAIAGLAAGTLAPQPQDRSLVTKAPKLRKEDGRIDWSRPARAVHDLVRAMQPWPGAESHWRRQEDGGPATRMQIHRTAVVEGSGEPGTVLESPPGTLHIATGEGAVSILIAQMPGKKPMPIAEILRGNRIAPGDRLGPPPSDPTAT